jgi:hypothetical protein
MLQYVRDTTVPPEAFSESEEEFTPPKLPTGVFCDEERPEYTELYETLCERAERER